jgi:tetratricopeptide (TPR) repeat protein
MEKAIALDPRRAIAYANLGDLYYLLNRAAEFHRAYEKYLELAPNAPYAPTVRLRLGR